MVNGGVYNQTESIIGIILENSYCISLKELWLPCT